MIGQAIAVFSSTIGNLISKVNKKETKKYEKYISISQKITLVAIGILFPLFIPLLAVMWISNEKIKVVESLAKGIILVSSSPILILLVLLYQLLEGRKFNIKELLIYDSICFLTFLLIRISLTTLL